MSEGYVEFSKIISTRISEDGKEIQLVCQGPDGGEFDMLIPARTVPDINQQLGTALRAALIRQHNPDPLPVRLPVFLMHLRCLWQQISSQLFFQTPVKSIYR